MWLGEDTKREFRETFVSGTLLGQPQGTFSSDSGASNQSLPESFHDPSFSSMFGNPPRVNNMPLTKTPEPTRPNPRSLAESHKIDPTVPYVKLLQQNMDNSVNFLGWKNNC